MKTSVGQRILAVSVALATVVVLSSCGGSSIEGTYGDPNGGTFIVLKSGGKATLTFMNQPTECTYTVKDDKVINVDCKEGTPLVLTLSEDRTTLTMPPGSFMPNMKKFK